MKRKFEQSSQETSISESTWKENSPLSAAGQRRMQEARDHTPPLSRDDKALMTIDFSQLQPKTREALQAQGITSTSIVNDSSQGEVCTRTVLEREGIPDGSGQMERVKRVVPGTYNTVHGIDLIAVTQDGKPMPIEVKTHAKYAKLDGKPKAESHLEPEVLQAKRDREQELQMYRDGQRDNLRLLRQWERDGRQKLDPDRVNRLAPDLRQQLTKMEDDMNRSWQDVQGSINLPVEQMDELWVKDRYLKLLRSDGGTDRLLTAGVHPKYCRIDNLVNGTGNLIETPLWDDILSQRMTVVVSPAGAPSGRKMFEQAVFEKKSNRVLKIAL